MPVDEADGVLGQYVTSEHTFLVVLALALAPQGYGTLVLEVCVLHHPPPQSLVTSPGIFRSLDTNRRASIRHSGAAHPYQCTPPFVAQLTLIMTPTSISFLASPKHLQNQISHAFLIRFSAKFETLENQLLFPPNCFVDPSETCTETPALTLLPERLQIQL